MSNVLYVATDAHGVEHTAKGHVTWNLPTETGPVPTGGGQHLRLRPPASLLEVLDERIYRAEAIGDAKVGADGVAKASSAQLVSRTPWSTETATRFAIQCAQHELGNYGSIKLPNGTTLDQILADAESALDGVFTEGARRLGHIATVRALWRLEREHTKLANLSLGIIFADERKDVEALSDPVYAAVTPVIDAVMAAVEALRHHVLPQFYVHAGDDFQEAVEHHDLDQTGPVGAPVAVESPLGAVVVGGPFALHFEPSWSAARESARHSREAAGYRSGPGAQAAELTWEADLLGALLESG